MQKFFDAFFGLIAWICKIMIMIQVVCVTIVVIGRYVFNVTPPWGEELTLFCLVWMSMIGMSLPIRDNTHLHITMFDNVFPKRVLSFLDKMADVIVVLFSIVIIVAGIGMTKQSARQILHGMRISKAYLYAAVPVSGITFLIAELERIMNTWGKKGSELK